MKICPREASAEMGELLGIYLFIRLSMLFSALMYMYLSARTVIKIVYGGHCFEVKVDMQCTEAQQQVLCCL